LFLLPLTWNSGINSIKFNCQVPTILPLASSLSSCCWLFSFQTNPSAAREIYSIWLLFQDFHKNCGGLLLKEPGAPKRSTHPRWSQGTLMFGNAVGHHLMWRTGRFISFWCEGKEFKKKNELLSQHTVSLPKPPCHFLRRYLAR